MIKINWNLIEKIKSALYKDDISYSRIKIEISKIFFALIATIYFFLYVSVLAWFYIEYTAKFLYSFYFVFLFWVFVLLYDLIVYWLAIYLPDLLKTKYIFLIILSIFYLIIISTHLWFKI